MNVLLFDDDRHISLKPLTYTRPVASLRIGILTIAEKWSKHLNAPVSALTMPYLREKFPATINDNNLVICGAILPDEDLCHSLRELKPNQKLISKKGELIAL